jgi:hypothetical protein
MGKLDIAQKNWLVDLGVIVGSRTEKATAKPTGSQGKAGATAPSATAIDLWKTRRTVGVGSLKAVASKIAGAQHASSAPAMAEIQAVLEKLNVEQPTLQQVTELQHYLGANEIVNDVCELVDDIRTPLLEALGQLHTALAA